MSRIFYTSILIVFFSINHSFADISFRNYSIDKAKGVAKFEKKNILVSFSADWCLPCKMLHEGAFKDVKLSGLLNSKFVNIEAYHEEIEDREWFYNYQISDLPIMLVINEKGEELTRISGLLTTEILIQTFGQYIDGGQPENPIDFQAMYKDKYNIRSTSEKEVKNSLEKVEKKKLIEEPTKRVLIAFSKFDNYKKAKKELKKLKSKHKIDAVLLEEIRDGNTRFMLISNTEYVFNTAAILFSEYQERGIDCTIKRVE